MKKFLSQLAISVVLFAVTSIVVFIVTYLLYDPIIGIPFPIMKTISFGPECRAGEMCPTILYQKVVFDWQMLVVDIVVWWVGVILFQHSNKIRKSVTSRTALLPIKLDLTKIVCGLLICFILYLAVTRLFITNKECGGFAGNTCPFGSRCIYEGNYPDADGTCSPIPEAILYRTIGN
ncbi:MAG: hypothetical protein NUV98_07025 [Candidatus Roizmanbacteria bacterium]|nr:hypothetical protein [Candidatus Roizmanbacteria bacterium]